MDINKLKVGAVLSESSFFKVQEVQSDKIIVKDDSGNELSIGKGYVESILNSADLYESEEKKTMTELAELFINSPRIAMTVAFYKKDDVKSKKVFNAEKQAMVDKFQNAKVSEIEKLVNEFIQNPITDTIKGELRVMKGRHYGHINDLGRISFVDMELEKGNKENDARLRLVDPRTLVYVIVNNVKYSLK